MTLLLHDRVTVTEPTPVGEDGSAGKPALRLVPPTAPVASSPAAFAAPDDDSDFALDMRVVESTTPLVIMMCSTSDGCGQSCSTSACTTKASDPL
ncbi:FxLD family lanthipeptide [Dactylosporangium sp. NPDC048998]|uniref:FxLD family lanthipeptide n=1 Tax=Dactylosporangium sp. NPDC048998 TaxID=3363976 RepID=UPI00371FC744